MQIHRNDQQIRLQKMKQRSNAEGIYGGGWMTQLSQIHRYTAQLAGTTSSNKQQSTQKKSLRVVVEGNTINNQLIRAASAVVRKILHTELPSSYFTNKLPASPFKSNTNLQLHLCTKSEFTQ